MAASPDQDHRPRVLVVDDDRALGAIVAGTLDSAGYAVTTTDDFDQATDLVKNTQPPFEAVIQDNSMPPHLDRILEMAKVLEREQIDTGLVGFTSDADTVINGIKRVLASMQLLRPYDVIAKGPGSMQNLIRAVARAAGLQP